MSISTCKRHGPRPIPVVFQTLNVSGKRCESSADHDDNATRATLGSAKA